MSVLTVRVNRSSHAKLKKLARAAKEPMVTILEKAIEDYRRKTFLEKANAAFAKLRRDRKAWKQEEAERAVWDQTVADGLRDE